MKTPASDKLNDKLVYIEWEDAHANSRWHDRSELEAYHNRERCIVRQVGWIYKENKDFITLYSRVVWWHSDDELGYGQLQKIPKTWIRKRKVIKL